MLRPCAAAGCHTLGAQLASRGPNAQPRYALGPVLNMAAGMRGAESRSPVAWCRDFPLLVDTGFRIWPSSPASPAHTALGSCAAAQSVDAPHCPTPRSTANPADNVGVIHARVLRAGSSPACSVDNTKIEPPEAS